MESENFASNLELNFPITINEVESFVSKLGDNKATGLDSIPNFVLKNQDVIKIPYYLFSKLFDGCMLPSMWLKSVINYIYVPKGSNKDPFVPLNYRGISLLSCVGKAFSGIINKRIVNYYESMKNKKNGFRRKRS